jgi:hypothetical protein
LSLAAGLLALALADPAPSRTPAWLRFGGGAVSAFALHETSHLVLDAAFDADPGLMAVDFHGIPFFAVTHRSGLPDRQEYAISAAGFFSQHVTSEMLLTRRPGLRHESAPFEKGVLAFDVLTSTGYALAAFAQTGPPERDTRGMAVSAGVPEPWIGALLLAPAALDTLRYHRPGTKWAIWASRATKALLLVGLFK